MCALGQDRRSPIISVMSNTCVSLTGALCETAVVSLDGVGTWSSTAPHPCEVEWPTQGLPGEDV